MKAGEILIAEGQFVIALDLRHILEGLGYTVIGMAASGGEVLALAEARRPALLIVAENLAGETDGIAIGQQVFARWQIPAVFMIAGRDTRLINTVIRSKPFSYVVKPFDAHDLGAAIRLSLYKARLESGVRETEDRFRVIADFSYNWEFWRGTDGRFRYISPASERISGYGPEAFMATPDLFTQIVLPEDRELIAGYFRADARRRSAETLNYRITARTGERRWLSLACMPLFSDEGTWMGWRGTVRDITEEKRTEARLKRLGFYDDLTGLPNRYLFFDQLRIALSRGRRYEHFVGLIYTDLDQFGRVNRQSGRTRGDEVLSALAKRLTECVRDIDTVARMGGDKFAIILQDIRTKEQVRTVGENIIRAVSQPIRMGRNTIRLSASLGICLYPFDGADSETLMRRGAEATFQAKKKGEAGYHFCNFYEADTPEESAYGPADEDMAYRIFYDSLTELPNRYLFFNRLTRSRSHAHQYGHSAALLCIDFSRFRNLPDFFLPVRRQALRHVAHRLKACIRDSDTAARIGESRFAVVLQDIRQKSDAEEASRKIIRALEPPVHINNESYTPEFCIGVSLYPFDGLTNHILIEKARDAMQRVRKTGTEICGIWGPGGEISFVKQR